MATKAKAADAKTAVLKGKEAEDKVLDYMKKMNRPFGAVDVSANLKGAVPKAAAQKILVALAERGDLVQKTCGKTTFFVVNQANLEDMPADKLAGLEAEYKKTDEKIKTLTAEARTLGAEVARLKGTPTDEELAAEIERAEMATCAYGNVARHAIITAPGLTETQVKKARAHLEPLRAGTPLISAEETAQLETEWTRWRGEWVRRRKVFTIFWSLATDALTPQQASELEEDLGIEKDTGEHGGLERGPLCVLGSVLGKRRRG